MARAYRPEVDGLRAIAVLAVVLFHLGWVRGGFVGVDVFFVISGYLITGLILSDLAEGRFSFADFYVRRARRLLPALFFTILATLAIGLVVSSPHYLERLAGSALAAVASASNIYFWAGTGYFDDEAIFKPLLHTWSLGVEEQFYYFWPALLVLTASTRRIWLGAAMIGLVGLLSFAGNLLLIDQHTTIYFLTPFRVFEFAIGALIVWLEKAYPERGFTGEACVVTGLALIIVPLAVFTKNTPFPGWNALYPCLGAALVIYGGASPLTGGLLRQPLLVGLGLRSYSVYLAHWPLISFYKSDTLARLTTTERITLLVASLAAGAAMYRFIEQPFRVREGRPARIPGRAAATIGLSASAVIAVVGSLLWVSDGWIARLPPELRTAVETMTAEQKDYWKFAMGQKFERSDKTNVLVFGNSFGIDTYYGLRQYDALSVVFSGTTHYGCFAFFVKANASSPDCLERNLALLRTNDVANADVIVLSELWGLHLGAQTYERELDRLFAAIRAINPTIKIVLVGPRMTFVGKVVDRLIQHKSLDAAEAVLSRHYAVPLNKIRDFDQTMRAHAALRNVAYVSLIDLMCGTGQCQVVTPGDHRQIYMDDGHFTRRGAEYVGRLTWERYSGTFARAHRREARLP